MTRREALALWAFGTVGFVVCCLLVEQGLTSAALYSDVHVYAGYGGAMTHGQIPYRDFFDEYPPLAQPVFALGRVAGAANYALAFKAFMALCGVGALGCSIFTLRALRAPLWRAGVATAVIAASPLLVGPIFLNAYDLWPAFLLSLALLLLVSDTPNAAFAVLGAAVAAKVYPVAALPVFVLAIPAACRRRALLWFVGVIVVAHLPFAILGPGGLRHSYVLQAKRGLELNSLGASILLLAGHPRTANQAPGSLNVLGGTAHVLAVVGTVLIVVAIVAAALAYLRGRPLLACVAASVAGFVAFNRVFSAQYVDWLVPLAPLAGLGASAVTVAVLVLTRLVFSHRTAIGNDHDVPLLFARDLLVVVLIVALLGSGARHRFPVPGTKKAA